MTFNLKRIVLSLTVTSAVAVAGFSKSNNVSTSSFDWNPIMEAIIQVESCGDKKAVNGQCCGAMQIAPVLVEDVNKILKKRGESKRYTLKDRYSVKKSKEMFTLIQSYYNPTNNIEKAIRSWNGGVHYKTRSTNGYYRKVLAAMHDQPSRA